MPAVVVLGMHRSGTSLVASMLDAVGVDMGNVKMGGHVSQPFGHWEDLDFVRMNTEILADAGGTWDDPPEIDFSQFRPEVALLVTLKQHPEINGLDPAEPRPEGAWWGFKDPRSCLTIGAYHQYLDNPHYVVVDRDKAATVASLEWREGKAGDTWSELYDLYVLKRDWFLGKVDAPRLRLRYEGIVQEPGRAGWKLAEFLGLHRVAGAKAAAAVVQPHGLRIPSEYIVNLSGSKVCPAPDQRVVNAAGWENGWLQVHGPVHGVVTDATTSREELQGWAAKVRPGGMVRGEPFELGKVNDWPGTAWKRWTSGFERKPYLQRGDGWGTIGIGVPYFKAVYDFWRWWTWLVRHGLEDSDILLNDDSVMAPLPIPVVHNRLIARFLETDRDTLCIVEDDHVGDVDVIRRMREKPENRDFDIVTANYVNRRADPGIVGYDLTNRKNRYGEYICKLKYGDVWKTGTQPVDGSVMGLVLIRRWVLDAMLAGGNPKHGYWCQWQGANSQDINFYGKARDVGARVGVDRDANIGHIGQVVRTVDDFWKARGAAPGGNK